MNGNAFFLALRRLRAPLIVLICIFSIAIVGLVLIPGVDANGKTWHMGFFHAFYIVSYTATTIGFGEIPYNFTDAQRLWITFCIYMSVVGWAYAIGKLLSVLQDRSFQQLVMEERFERRVEALAEPFYLICGYGETGQILCQSLDRLDKRFVVIDHDAKTIDELELQDFRVSSLGYRGDARLPKNLIMAGIGHRYCNGVVAITGDDSANLAVAIASRLFNEAVPAICCASSAEVAANMASFGTRHIIDPFEKFGENLALSVRSPGSFQLLEWLTSLPGTGLERHQHEPPKGLWLICGYGRFGKSVVKHLRSLNLDFIIVDPRRPFSDREYSWVRGIGTEAVTLLEAGVERAVALVAGTDDDVNNLSILVTARELNPDLFFVVLENHEANHDLFRAVGAEMTVIPSAVIAHECLGLLTSPLSSRFLDIVRQKDDCWADSLLERLASMLDSKAPFTWCICLDHGTSSLLLDEMKKTEVQLELFRYDPLCPEVQLLCVPLLIVRNGLEIELPDWEFTLLSGDEILFAGSPGVLEIQESILRMPHLLHRMIYGEVEYDSWIWKKMSALRHRLN